MTTGITLAALTATSITGMHSIGTHLDTSAALITEKVVVNMVSSLTQTLIEYSQPLECDNLTNDEGTAYDICYNFINATDLVFEYRYWWRDGSMFTKVTKFDIKDGGHLTEVFGNGSGYGLFYNRKHDFTLAVYWSNPGAGGNKIGVKLKKGPPTDNQTKKAKNKDYTGFDSINGKNMPDDDRYFH